MVAWHPGDRVHRTRDGPWSYVFRRIQRSQPEVDHWLLRMKRSQAEVPRFRTSGRAAGPGDHPFTVDGRASKAAPELEAHVITE